MRIHPSENVRISYERNSVTNNSRLSPSDLESINEKIIILKHFHIKMSLSQGPFNITENWVK